MSEIVTLPQTRLLSGDDVDRNVIDEFTKSNFVLSTIPFHRAAAPSGGSALAYTYTRLTTQANAAFRALGADYTKAAAEVAQYTVTCAPLGGSFGIDRVLAASGAGAQIALQMTQKIKGAQAAFADAVINGDKAADANGFDGLSVALTGSATEIDGSALDWTNATASTAGAYAVLEALDALLSEVNGSDGVAILGNKTSIARIRNAARIAGAFAPADAGNLVATYSGVPLVDLGARAGSNLPVIDNRLGASDIYAVRLAMDGFHAVSPVGAPIVSTRLPNPDSDSAVLTGWVEMVATVALKATNAAAVLRRVKVA